MARSPSVLEVCLARGGMMKGTRVATYIVQWSMCGHDLGREPGMEEFVQWWGEPRSTVYRQQQEFREVFPEWSTPEPFAREVGRRLDASGRSPGDRAAVAVLAEVEVA